MKRHVVSYILALLILFNLPGLAPIPIAIATVADDWARTTIFAAGNGFSIAAHDDGSLWAWGSNDYAQLGDGSRKNKYDPVKIGTEPGWVSISAGDDHTLAIKSDGSLWGWGDSDYGQLFGSAAKIKPAQIGTDKEWASVSAGHYFSLAIKTDGNLWAWGNGGSGQLGDGTTVNKGKPVQIGTDTDWKSVSAGYQDGFAIKTNGSLWAWGRNGFGQHGNGTSASSNTPVQVGADTNWAYVSACDKHVAALKTDGSLWTWGNNSSGQLGDGTTKSKNIPAQVGSVADWAHVSVGQRYTVALKTDGSLWSWGHGYQGQLGNEANDDKKTPTRIGVDTDWVDVTAGYEHALALKSNGSLWVWGNTVGVLKEAFYEPMQIWGPPVPVSDVVLNKSSLEIPIDYHAFLTAKVKPACADNQTASWSSSDETIAVVGDTGRITGVALGTATITATTVDGGFTASCEVTVVENIHRIDYEGMEDVIVPGSQAGFSINLDTETLTIPGTYTPKLYSIDGGGKWKAVNGALSAEKFPKLLNKDLSLMLSDKPIDKTTKKPTEGATVVSFPKIIKRAAAPKLVVNYAIGADPTGLTTGDWLLTEKNGTKAVKDGIQVASTTPSGKRTDENGYGWFYPGETNGIPIKALTGDKPEKTVYLIRTAPQKNSATYTAASKPKKITVAGEQKAPKYKVKLIKEKKNRDGSVKTPSDATVKLKKGDFICAGVIQDIGTLPKDTSSVAVELTAMSILRVTGSKGSTVSVKGVSGTVTIWKEATAKKPASAKQTIMR